MTLPKYKKKTIMILNDGKIIVYLFDTVDSITYNDSCDFISQFAITVLKEEMFIEYEVTVDSLKNYYLNKKNEKASILIRKLEERLVHDELPEWLLRMIEIMSVLTDSVDIEVHEDKVTIKLSENYVQFSYTSIPRLKNNSSTAMDFNIIRAVEYQLKTSGVRYERKENYSSTSFDCYQINKERIKTILKESQLI